MRRPQDCQERLSNHRQDTNRSLLESAETAQQKRRTKRCLRNNENDLVDYQDGSDTLYRISLKKGFKKPAQTYYVINGTIWRAANQRPE
jgi:hypothetical protein